MRIRALILIVVLIPFKALAYENAGIHPGITDQAILNSSLKNYFDKLGSILDKTKPGETLSCVVSLCC